MKYYILLFIAAITGVVSAQQKMNDTITKVEIDNPINLPFGTLDKNRVVGAVDVITAENLSHTSDYNVESAMAGLVSGLTVTKGNGEPGIDNTFLKIRGLSRGGNDFPLIVIDGIANRALSSISLDEIESIQILKDATAKMLYGSRAANGVIMVNTKRGYDGKKKITFFTETGFKSATELPEFINSSQYAVLKNQALINDGFEPEYSAEQIEGFNSGSDPLLYPNVDFYDTFLKKSTTFQRINAQLIGGNENTKYFLNLGFIEEDGLEKVGTQKFNRLNIRGNLDYKVNNTISMVIDIAGRMDIWDTANLSNDAFFGTLSSHRPDDYPLFVGEFGDTDNLGWSQRVGTNLYGELTRKGYSNTKNYYSQSNLGFNLDFNKFITGLTGGAFVTFDSFNRVSIGKNLDYSTVDPITLERRGNDTFDDSESRQGDNFSRNIGFIGNLDYVNSWGKSDLQINLSSVTQTLSRKTTISAQSVAQDNKNINIGLRVNYMFDDKYVIEGTSSYMGSDKFTKENRWGLFGAGGFAWILSNEDFLKNSSVINFLKLKGSAGVLGYDRENAFDYLLDQNFYVSSGNFRTGNVNQFVDFGFRQGQIGNPDLTFEKSREINVGIESTLFNNTFNLEVNYFDEFRYDMPTTLSNLYPDYIGELSPIGNFNEVSNKGIDLSIQYTNKIGNLQYSLGGNMIYSKAVDELVDELNAYSHLNRTGQVSDAIFGFKANGLYQNQGQIDASGVTSSFGDILPGDIIYENFINDRGDNIIDNFDQQLIGNSSPRLNYALNLNLNYKGWNLFVLGQGASGFDRMLSNTYYRNFGENKYSVQALGAAVPGSVAGATHPRLTSLSQGHSYRNSSYWMVPGDFFKIRTAELSYNFGEDTSSKIGASALQLFVRANDFLAFSKIKDLDPENLNAGVNSYPMYTTISAGLKLTY